MTNAYADWHAVLAAQRSPDPRPGVRLTAGRIGDGGSVSVTLSVDPAAGDPVEFGDNLYGATAWAADGSGWRRVDTAEMRLMIAPRLGPGETADLQLPLAPDTPRPVRVLLDGTWIDVDR